MKVFRNSILVMVICYFSACGKEFLEIKKDRSVSTPKTIKDYQAVLDNSTAVMNANSCHELGFIGSDEYYSPDNIWATLKNPYQKNGYIWAEDVYEKNDVIDWNRAYQRILYANFALDGVVSITPGEKEISDWNNVRGSALFFRALNFYQLAQQFCNPYDSKTANIDPGIPLRLESDINIISTRPTVAAVYDQIIKDLNTAVELLPTLVSNKLRPSKPAVYGLLAKVYLQMEDYEKAKDFSTKSLATHGDLIDFNTLDLNLFNTFILDYGASNKEVIFSCNGPNNIIMSSSRFSIDTTILKSYDEKDLRKKAYFRVNKDINVAFKGSYAGTDIFFTGIATDEILLIRAECFARLGDIENGLKDLNYLLKNRFETGFNPLIINDRRQLLEKVIEERRKELFLRGVRWEDLRRLNKDDGFAKELVRKINGVFYRLSPNDSKYVWPLPDNVIDITGMKQNPR